MVDFGQSDTITTLSRTHASLTLASEQVSSKFRAGLGPDSIMDFGLYTMKLARQAGSMFAQCLLDVCFV